MTLPMSCCNIILWHHMNDISWRYRCDILGLSMWWKACWILHPIVYDVFIDQIWSILADSVNTISTLQNVRAITFYATWFYIRRTWWFIQNYIIKIIFIMIAVETSCELDGYLTTCYNVLNKPLINEIKNVLIGPSFIFQSYRQQWVYFSNPPKLKLLC